MLRQAAAIGLVLGLSAGAYANPASLVAGGTDPDELTPLDVAQKRVDVFVGVDYQYEQDGSSIRRERVGDPNANPLAPLASVKDLTFKQFKHTVIPHIDVGIYHDTFIYAALPIIIAQARELRLDSGVDRTGSSTIADGLLPMQGFDARDPGTPPPGDLVFRGVNRHGLDQLKLGLGFAPMNQRSDDTKPTWKIGAELDLSVGSIMKFDPTAPGGNTGVSTGVHQLTLWTSFDRKVGWAEPWVTLFWQTPIGIRQDSLFVDPGFGATNSAMQQQAGARFGLELYAVDDPKEHNRISLDLGAHAIAHFEGRDYSEMWEVFAAAGDSRGMGPLILDADPTKSGVQPMSHPGITNIENYLETGTRVAVRAELGPHIRFAALGDVIWKTNHAITFADAGVDLPTCSATLTTHCETDQNELVNPGTEEVNPLHSQRIDLVGHRYLSVNNLDFVIGLETQILF